MTNGLWKLGENFKWRCGGVGDGRKELWNNLVDECVGFYNAWPSDGSDPDQVGNGWHNYGYINFMGLIAGLVFMKFLEPFIYLWEGWKRWRKHKEEEKRKKSDKDETK